MINEQLAQLSDLAIVVAIAVYVLAMIGFGADLAAGSQRRSDARLAAAQAHEADGSGSVADVGARAERGGSRAVGSDAVAGGGIGVLERERTPGPGDATPQSGMSAGTFAMLMTGAAVALHGVAVVLRGLATQRVPWGNMYEFAMTGSFAVILAFTVIALRRPQWRVLGTFIVAPMLLLLLTAQKFWFLPAAQLTPSLQNSWWLVIHVLVAILASSLYTIGAVVSVLQLIQGRRERGALPQASVVTGETGASDLRPQPAGRVRGALGAAGSRAARITAPVMDRLPSSSTLEGLAFRIHAVGFVLWTFTLIAGSIWANYAWGRYWGWDPKEVWTFVIWVVYAAYLHARATRGFRGNRAAWFALVGFACLIFNFTVVNTVINGLHSYSGLT